MEIDSLDRRLLAVLQRDARQSLEDLGAQVGLSRNACWRRVRALEEAGLIQARVALLDATAVGVPLTVFAHIKAARHDRDWAERFAAATRALPEITGVYRLSGDLDYLIRAQVADVADYDRLYQRLIARVDMAEISASFVMEAIKDTTELPI